MTNNDFYWYWFTNIAGIGVKTQKKLLEHFGHPSTIYNAPESEIKGILTTGQCKEVIASKNQKKIEASIRKLEKREIYFFHRESQEYPERLAQLYEPPNLLYYIGRLPNFSKPILAIVGARRATIYGRKMAREFAKRLAECGIQIVSGMAAGVDAAGHKGALDANGYTLGVLGGGIDTIYPVENFNLYQQVYQMGGVLSEYNMGISPQKGLFPMRNRIISGLSDGIFVTEAGARSGSLITADQGLEQGKDIFALPGRITDCMSRGCNDLISQGAVLVRSPEDIMDIIIKEGKTGNKKKNMDVNRENVDIFAEVRALPWRALGLAACCFAGMFGSVLTVGREALSDYRQWSADDMALANHIDENAGSDALFLTSDSHLTPVFALAGRRILCGSGSYVYYHGMDYSAEYNAMRALYETPDEDTLAAWDIGYAVFDNSVYAKFAADESWYAARYDVWYENAACRVYKIK